MDCTLERRMRRLNDQPVGKDKTAVLYVMARDQRLRDNHALALAQQQAIQLGVPLAVVFCLQPQAANGQRAREHYQFMLAGLRELESDLAKYNIPLLMVIGRPLERLRGVMYHLKPQLTVFDYDPLRGSRRLHETLAAEAPHAMVEVDTHNIVPVWQASDHQEVAARSLRPKLRRLLVEYLPEPEHVTHHPHAWPGPVQSLKQLQPWIDELLAGVPANGTECGRRP